MQPRTGHCLLLLLLLLAGTACPALADAGWTLVGWNNLGMHCMDPDYAVFALLPPYNTLVAQLVDANGRLVTDDAGVTVTYAAVADPDGSMTRSSAERTNFWTYVGALFGVEPAVDVGLAGNAMPGAANAPQPMHFDPARGWFIAEGIPITPHDDAGRVNTYPLMRLVARDTGGAVLATTDVVLPVSEELNCRTCHASGSSPAAQPFGGWLYEADPERDTRLNILQLHDDLEGGNAAFSAALASAGYGTGLTDTARAGTPILCARCHASEALPGSGLDGISSLTRAVHHRMAGVRDPISGLRLDDIGNREACYRCHPGSTTRCLRGAMGRAVAADGSLAMQCQSCHGSMRDVAAETRTGWLDEPTCQQCHTGTALQNTGGLRHTSAFDDSGVPRLAATDTFATTPDAPLPGHSLYRYSTGHGGLACEACHGATHAEYPSTTRNDNLQSIAVQGHAGVLAECTACHATAPNTVDGGPHGLHPLGAAWVQRHPDVVENGGAQRCRACHGTDYRGTVLSRVRGDRVLNTEFGTKHFWPGFQVGCYACHNGPGSEQANPNRAPVADDGNAGTRAGQPVEVALGAHDADSDPLALRIVDQPANGTVGLDGTTARYIPAADFSGDDAFTFTASDGDTDGNLATVRVHVAAACAGDCDASGTVTVDELVRGVALALGDPVAPCPAFDTSHDGVIDIAELILAVRAALNGC
ncbi:MAG: Ig-like domain-containing protein [Deltaproteobacteria bacterium]|nr:Ig-like domain-containing protein [Deltaproteobacteria bacterium]